MKKIIVYLLCFIVGFTHCLAKQFIYPVASVDDDNILLVRQKSIDDVELLLWNTQNNIATKQLSSIFLPSQIQLLPSKQGFSFIDKGRIRIKRFQKRAPRSIDIVEPISAIASMSWIDDDHFYFTGKHYEYYKVFLCDVSDKVRPQIFHISNSDNMDYLYPFKVGSQLFDIARDELNNYHIIEHEWSPQPYGAQLTSPQVVIYSSSEPLCFLQMKNSKEGYFLQCNIKNIEYDDLLTFTCYQSIFDTDYWSVKPLFSFKLPLQYLIGESSHRVYESIYPFLPVYQDNAIYYINYDLSTEKCLLYEYDKKENFSNPCLYKNFLDDSGHLAPLCTPDKMYLGLIMSSGRAKNVFFMNEETGEIEVNLPSKKIKK